MDELSILRARIMILEHRVDETIAKLDAVTKALLRHLGPLEEEEEE